MSFYPKNNIDIDIKDYSKEIKLHSSNENENKTVLNFTKNDNDTLNQNINIDDDVIISNKIDCNVTNIINKAKEESRVLIDLKVKEIKNEVKTSMDHIVELIKNISLSVSLENSNGNSTIINNYNNTIINKYDYDQDKERDKDNKNNNNNQNQLNNNTHINTNINANTNNTYIINNNKINNSNIENIPKSMQEKINQDLLNKLLAQLIIDKNNKNSNNNVNNSVSIGNDNSKNMEKNKLKKKKKHLKRRNALQQGMLVVTGSSQTNIINKNIKNLKSGNGILTKKNDDESYRRPGITTAKLSKRH
jgi:hypothetical protein